MDSNKIYQVLLDQKEELNQFVGPGYVIRPETDYIDLDSKLAQVVIGVRRSGKSTLCHMALQRSGQVYGYVNFDDDRLARLTIDDLNGVLEGIYRVYGADIKYLFFDEIQNVDGWHLFVNRLLRAGFHLVVTGSNAKLLSSELATHLTGRYHEIQLYPFSFKDYCAFNNVMVEQPSTRNVAEVKNALDSYLLQGGFPEISSLKNPTAYVGGLLDAIITKDIMIRFNLRNGSGLKTLVNYLINNAGQLINISELVNTLNIGSDKTVRNYIDYLSQAFLIVPVAKYSFKCTERLRNNKAYVVDTGMMTFQAQNVSTENWGWRLENVVLLELLRRCAPLRRDVFYYRQSPRSNEIDFVVTERGKIMQLIQVAYDVTSPKTLARELKALVDVSEKTGCTSLLLIACTDSRTEVYNGHEIDVVSAHEWLLG